MGIRSRRIELANNWRLAVCTRWRPLVSTLLVCGSVLSTGYIACVVYTKVDEYPAQRLEKDVHRVKVGMSIAELEKILGPPNSRTERVKSGSLDAAAAGPERIYEYGYSADYRFSDIWSEYGGIFVDEDSGRVVSFHLTWNTLGWLDSSFVSEWLFLLAIGLIVLVVLIVMLFFRRWCRSVTDRDE